MSHSNSILAGTAVGALGLVIVVLVVALMAIPAILAAVVLSRVPPEHRKQSPGLAFLLLIPLFSLVWMFFVHPRVADSLKSYFDSKGDTTVGDCGRTLALWLCICGVCSIIPFINIFAGLGALVLLIIFYVKAFELSGRIQRT